MRRHAIFALRPTGFGKSLLNTVAYCGVTGSDAKLTSLLALIKRCKLLLRVKQALKKNLTRTLSV